MTITQDELRHIVIGGSDRETVLAQSVLDLWDRCTALEDLVDKLGARVAGLAETLARTGSS